MDKIKWIILLYNNLIEESIQILSKVRNEERNILVEFWFDPENDECCEKEEDRRELESGCKLQRASE